MKVNGNWKAIIENRRRHVADWVLRGLTQREIREKLAEAGLTNPSTDRPWSLGVVNRDIRILGEEWRTKAAGDLGKHKGRILAELQLVKKVAWSKGKLRLVLSAISQERDLLGLDAKQLTVDEVDWLNGRLIEVIGRYVSESHQKAFAEELDRIREGL